MNGKYELLVTKTAKKHKNFIKQYASLEKNVLQLLEIIKENPYQNPPPYEALVGNLKGLYSRRINNQHRLVYKIDEGRKEIAIVSMWSHYEY